LSESPTIASDTAIIALTVVLVVLTVVLVALGIDASQKLKRVHQITERFFHLGILLSGSLLEETVSIPLSWTREDYQSVVNELSEIDGISVKLLKEEMTVTYRLNQENETLEILLKDCRQPEQIKDKLSLYSKL
jgi:hypothetical protein